MGETDPVKRALPGLALGCLLVTSCTTSAPPSAPPSALSSAAPEASGSATGASDPGPAAAGLALAPEDTAYLTVTDWAQIKERAGAADLTSESLQTDRSEFWRAVPSSTVLLTDGALREQNSLLAREYGVTQDDVLWEVRWVPEGDARAQGLALRLRDDLDLEGLGRAVADGVPGVEGGEVVGEEHLLLRGGADDVPLAGDAAVVAALAGGAESELVAPGCLSWPVALGPDATVEQQDSVVDDAGVVDLLDPQAWGVAFTGRAATVTVVYPEGTTEEAAGGDAEARVALGEAWPTTESVGWSDAFGLSPSGPEEGYAVHQRGGRTVATFDYRVVSTTAAATVVLAGLVPQAVCAEIDWLEEPTGL